LSSFAAPRHQIQTTFSISISSVTNPFVYIQCALLLPFVFPLLSKAALDYYRCKKYLVIAISLQRLLMMPKLLLLSLSSMVPFLRQGIGVLHPLDQSDPRYRSSNLLSPVGRIVDPYNKHHRTSPHCTLCRHSRIYQDLVYNS
jgi:hypothetical protein